MLRNMSPLSSVYIRLLRGSYNSLENEQRSEKMNLGLRKNLRGFNFDSIVLGT